MIFGLYIIIDMLFSQKILQSKFLKIGLCQKMNGVVWEFNNPKDGNITCSTNQVTITINLYADIYILNDLIRNLQILPSVGPRPPLKVYILTN